MSTTSNAAGNQGAGAPAETTTTMVMFDGQNLELRTVHTYFDARDGSVEMLSWQQTVRPGANVAPGVQLAEIFWDDGTKEILIAPDGCTGVVQITNGNIDYESLHLAPQMLLRLRK